ncbi:MAG: hypothetical protein ACP5SB_01275 [Caldisericaceae bacterium]
MKKILLGVFIFIFASVPVLGCGRHTVQIELSDKVNALGTLYAKSCTVDGKNVAINSGKIDILPGQHTVRVPGYYDAEINVGKDLKDTKIVLTPRAYLEISTNVVGEKIFLDDANYDYVSSNSITFSAVENFSFEPLVIVISPLSVGEHSILLTNKYFKDFSTMTDVKEGKNTLDAFMKPDEQQIIGLLNSISFPEDTQNFDFKIDLSGSLNGVNLSNSTLNGKVSSKKVVEISDTNIDYTLDKGKLYIGNTEVEDSEKSQALLFAINTVQEFIESKKLMTQILLSASAENVRISYDGSSGTIGFISTKAFEDRPVSEKYIVGIKDKFVESVSISVDSDPLKTNLRVFLDITRR